MDSLVGKLLPHLGQKDAQVRVGTGTPSLKQTLAFVKEQDGVVDLSLSEEKSQQLLSHKQAKLTQVTGIEEYTTT